MSDNDWTDNEEDYCEELPDWFIADEEFNKNMLAIYKFKETIKKQDIFIGIDYISSYEIFKLIEKKRESRSNKLDFYEVELFDDLYMALFNKKETKEKYEAVVDGIMARCYVLL